jgi:hypothetical protein
MRLVLPILLIATGVLLAVTGIRALIARTSRQGHGPAQRRKFWTWLHVGMLDIGNGLLQCFHQPRWNHDPWLLMLSCYTGVVLVWTFLPYIRRSRSGPDEATPAE